MRRKEGVIQESLDREAGGPDLGLGFPRGDGVRRGSISAIWNRERSTYGRAKNLSSKLEPAA